MNETEQGAVIDALRTQLAAAERERDEAKSHAEAMQIERDEMRANMEFIAGEARQAIASAKRERDEARAAPAAPAEMARDVAWCEALRDCGYPIARVAGIALGVDGVAAASVAEAATFGEDIAAAIRAAKP